MEFVYETIGLIVFIMISLAFIKTPVWLTRCLNALLARVDRWM